MRYDKPATTVIGSAATSVKASNKGTSVCADGGNNPNGSSTSAYESDE